ncbi:hypothetical protein MTHERMOG20_01360 [Moorella thermoacetica]|nr:hypothetical protein MTHERMOG20_01360 [Moorella thermoacetica]
MVVPELLQQGPQLPLSFHPENRQAGDTREAAVRAPGPAPGLRPVRVSGLPSP